MRRLVKIFGLSFAITVMWQGNQAHALTSSCGFVWPAGNPPGHSAAYTTLERLTDNILKVTTGLNQLPLSQYP